MPSRTRVILVFLAVADCIFLVLVGGAVNAAMHLAHALALPFLASSVIGMLFAMIVQIAMAISAAPVLGEIESMVPSMILAMSSPMLLCVSGLFGTHLSMGSAVIAGAFLGLLTFVAVELGNRYYQRELNRGTMRP